MLLTQIRAVLCVVVLPAQAEVLRHMNYPQFSCDGAPPGFARPRGPHGLTRTNDSLRERLIAMALLDRGRVHSTPPRPENWIAYAGGMPYPKAELANIPSTRTFWSASSWIAAAWLDLHRMHAAAAADYQRRETSDVIVPRQPSASSGSVRQRDIIFVGDSIVEAMRGTMMGCSTQNGRLAQGAARAALRGASRAPLFFGIAGDSTQHLLWRLRDGELIEPRQPRTLQTHAQNDEPAASPAGSRLVYVVMIGTNNLGMGHSPEATAQGIVAVVEEILTRTALAHVLVSAVLPRHDHKLAMSRQRQAWLAVMMQTNRNVSSALSGVSQKSRMTLVDCGGRLTIPGDELDSRKRFYLPDGIHPSPEGYARLLDCLAAALGVQTFGWQLPPPPPPPPAAMQAASMILGVSQLPQPEPGQPPPTSCRLVKGLSQSPCERSLSYGCNAVGIWIDRGCRGKFECALAHGRQASHVVLCGKPGTKYRPTTCPCEQRYPYQTIHGLDMTALTTGLHSHEAEGDPESSTKT